MLNFEAQPAFVYDCPVCAERYIGGHPSDDQRAHHWMTAHGDWHEAGHKIPPVITMNFVGP